MLKSKNCKNGCQSATGQPMGNLSAIADSLRGIRPGARDAREQLSGHVVYSRPTGPNRRTGLSAPQLPIGPASCNRLLCHDLCRCGREMEARTEGRRRKDQTGEKKRRGSAMMAGDIRPKAAGRRWAAAASASASLLPAFLWQACMHVASAFVPSCARPALELARRSFRGQRGRSSKA